MCSLWFICKNTFNKQSDVDIILTLKEVFQSIITRNKLIESLEINIILSSDSKLTITPLLIEIAPYAKILLDKNNSISKVFTQIQHKYESNSFSKISKGGVTMIQIE